MTFLSKIIKITYGVTVCNESDELELLLKCLKENIDINDEIIVLSDQENVTEDVLKTINIYGTKIKNLRHISFPLNNDFATFKNNLIDHATGSYLFQIDADETPNIKLIKNIKQFLFFNWRYDCFRIPRVNIVNGISCKHIEKWNWNIDDKNRINYPDLQMRLFKLNKGVKWINKVHEILINYKKLKNLPYKTEKYCLYHIKHIEKQMKQNDFYNTIAK